jgi:hypothetical protein
MKQNQYRRRENLCIIGLTENEEENCFDILKSLCMAMSITLEKSDVVRVVDDFLPAIFHLTMHLPIAGCKLI